MPAARTRGAPMPPRLLQKGPLYTRARACCKKSIVRPRPCPRLPHKIRSAHAYPRPCPRPCTAPAPVPSVCRKKSIVRPRARVLALFLRARALAFLPRCQRSTHRTKTARPLHRARPCSFGKSPHPAHGCSAQCPALPVTLRILRRMPCPSRTARRRFFAPHTKRPRRNGR